MPTEIVTETCPAPQCKLNEHDIEQLLDELSDYMALFAPAFERVEQWERSGTYLRGLLGDAARKNVEQMALELGENVRNLQYYVGQSPWKTEPVIEIHQRLVWR
jgi:SRSO17 transposase